MCKSLKREKKKRYINDLLDFVFNNPKNFELNWIRTENIQLKLFDKAVTLK